MSLLFGLSKCVLCFHPRTLLVHQVENSPRVCCLGFCLYLVRPSPDHFELEFPPSALSTFIFCYTSAWILIQPPTPDKTSLSVGELSVSRCSLTTVCFCCSSPFSPPWTSRAPRSQGLWVTRILDHKALLTLMIFWEQTNQPYFLHQPYEKTQKYVNPFCLTSLWNHFCRNGLLNWSCNHQLSFTHYLIKDEA